PHCCLPRHSARAGPPIVVGLSCPLLPRRAPREPSTGRLPIKTFYVKRESHDLGRSQGAALHPGRVRAAWSSMDSRAVWPGTCSDQLLSARSDLSTPCSGVKAAYGLPALTPCARDALSGPNREELVA